MAVHDSGEENRIIALILRTPRYWIVALATGGLLVLWWWPGIAGTGSRPEVSIVASEPLASARQEVSERLREAGLSVRWIDGVDSWCMLADRLPDIATPQVVVGPDDWMSCAQSPEELSSSAFSDDDRARLLIVSLDPVGDPTFDYSAAGQTTQLLVAQGVRRVTVERLIGATDRELPCIWWEDCSGSGMIITRDARGLTAAGNDRLARLVAAQVT